MDGGGGSQNQNHSGSYFKPLAISMAGIACSVIAILAYHLLVVRYCIRRNRSTQNPSLTQPVPGNCNGGVEAKVLFMIPVLRYSAKDSGSDNGGNSSAFRVDQNECVICLGEFEDGDTVRLLPDCRHAFHKPCIDDWFSGHSNCPVCRSPIVEPDIRTTDDVESPAHGDDDHERRNEEIRNLNDDAESQGQSNDEITCEESASTSTSTSQPDVEPGGLPTRVRHNSLSAVPLGEPERRRLADAELRRSLSMDQYYVIVNVSGPNKKESSSSSQIGDVLTDDRSYRSRSMRQLDRMSSRLARSFSQLRIGRCSSSTSNRILPY